MPKLSVVIPVYNVQEFLPRCLDSVINQTFNDMEIICVNDGSPDNCAEILEQYAKRDNRIKIITQENQGLSMARNNGMAIATGEYIGFIDSDDWVDINFYEELMRIATENNADVAMAGTKLIQSDGVIQETQINKPYCTTKLSEKLKRLPNGAVWNKIFKRDLLLKNKLEFPRGRYFEDNVVLVKSMQLSKRMAFTDKVFYWYYLNMVGICRSPSPELLARRVDDKFWVSEHILEYAKENKFSRCEVYQTKKFLVRSLLNEFIHHGNPHLGRARKLLGGRLTIDAFLQRIKKLIWFDYVSRGDHKKRLLGICVYRQKVPFEKNWLPKNFHQMKVDDTQLLRVLGGLKKFTYIANPGNMGDMMIAKATYDFLDDNGFDYEVYEYQSGRTLDTVVYGGGGIWVKDLYLNSDEYLEIFKRAKRIVILPSSVFECKRLIDVMDKRFTVFAREKQTYDYLVAQNTGAEIILDHDMALRLKETCVMGPLDVHYKRVWNKIRHKLPKRQRYAIFARTDVEKSSKLKSDLDLSSCTGSLTMTKAEADAGTKLMMASVVGYKKIVTDRLHVGIAAALMGRQLQWHDNSYGKVSAVYENSLQQNDKAKIRG